MGFEIWERGKDRTCWGCRRCGGSGGEEIVVRVWTVAELKNHSFTQMDIYKNSIIIST